MLKSFKKLFRKSPLLSTESGQEKSQPEEHSLSYYFEKELFSNEFIKPESKPIVMDHLMGKINILKTENKLTKEEKKELGINTRLSITRELVEVLTNEGIRHENKPNNIIENIYHRSSTEKYRDDELIKMKELGIAQFTIMNCDDEGDCEWSKSITNKKFNIEEDINSLIKSNCKSPYCRCSIKPVIEI